ncbi:hypothetical protein [Deinococcus planocerae]|nr:hypothetical protein [Deinococcus planocerae]
MTRPTPQPKPTPLPPPRVEQVRQVRVEVAAGRRAMPVLGGASLDYGDR